MQVSKVCVSLHQQTTTDMTTLTTTQAKQIVSEMKALFPNYSVKQIAAYLEMEVTFQNVKELVDAK